MRNLRLVSQENRNDTVFAWSRQMFESNSSLGNRPIIFTIILLYHGQLPMSLRVIIHASPLMQLMHASYIMPNLGPSAFC